VTLDGEPATAFESDKVRALLAYLAVEADRPHRREKLIGLLWPDWPERSARQNLSQALCNLRAAIGDRDADLPAGHPFPRPPGGSPPLSSKPSWKCRNRGVYRATGSPIQNPSEPEKEMDGLAITPSETAPSEDSCSQVTKPKEDKKWRSTDWL
jgi:hypothetical protein